MRRKKCKYEKVLRDLAVYSKEFIRWMDAEMQKPSSHHRGVRVANALNVFEMEVDKIRYFTLGVDYRKDIKS